MLRFRRTRSPYDPERPERAWQLFVTRPRGAAVVGVTMIAAITGLGLLLPTSQHLASLMVVVPATAVALTGPRLTAALAVLSCGAAIALDARDGIVGTPTFAGHLLAITLVSALVIASRRVRERTDRELVEVLAVSETVQRVLLRPLPARVGPLRIRSVYHASHPYALIGGDLYAVARLPASVRVMIGDVKGKGLPAVEDAAALLGAFHSAAHRSLPIPDLMAGLERSMRRHFEQRAAVDLHSAERFITVLVVEIPDDHGPLRLVNCGHPPPYAVSDAGAAPLTAAQVSPPLGLSGLSPADYREESFPLHRDTTLLLYTDGAIEARDPAGHFYDLRAGLTAWTASGDADLLTYVLDDLTQHVGGSRRLDDDIALVALSQGEDGGSRAGRAEPSRA